MQKKKTHVPDKVETKQNKQNNNLVMQVKNGSFLNKSEILNPKKIKNVSFGEKNSKEFTLLCLSLFFVNLMM